MFIITISNHHYYHDKTNLTDEVCAERDSMKDRAEVEIEKAAIKMHLYYIMHRAVSNSNEANRSINTFTETKHKSLGITKI